MTPPYSLNVCAAVGAARGVRRHGPTTTGMSTRSRNRRALLYAGSSGSAFATGRATPISCSRRFDGRGTDVAAGALWHAAFTFAIARTIAGCGDCLRDHRRRRRAHARVSDGARVAAMRRATSTRAQTRHGSRCASSLDGKGRYDVHSGIRFLDHMLELFARHGGFDLKLAATRRPRRRSAPHRRGHRHCAR